MPAPPLPLRVAAAVLAAGEGRRLGGCNKALIEVNGTPLLVRLWQLLAEAGIGAGVVVTGAHVPGLPLPAGWRLVHHSRHADGQPGSVRCALAALRAPETPPWDLALLLPCDLPLLRAADIRELLDAWTPCARLLRPVHHGQPAHPVLLSPEAAHAVLAAGPAVDVRAFVQAEPQALRRLPVDHDRGAFDLDTPADLQALRERTGWTVST